MNLNTYTLFPSEDLTVFHFVSTGSKGQIRKIIRYMPTLNPKVYNLGLADVLYIDGNEDVFTVDDHTASDNGDIDKLVGTVARSLLLFSQHYPDVFVVFGSINPVKMRLYRIIVQKYYDELSKTFILFVAKRQDDGKIVNVPFYFNANVDGFFIKLKSF